MGHLHLKRETMRIYQSIVRCFIVSLFVIEIFDLFMGNVVTVVTAANLNKYVIGETGVQGTSILKSSKVASVIICAAKCSTISGCQGFNWIDNDSVSTSNNCGILSSLRTVTSFVGCDLYVPVRAEVRAIELKFGCPTCYGGAPAGNIPHWPHSCNDNGVAIGVASVTDMTDLDFLLCMHLSGMEISYSTASFTNANNDRNCNVTQNHLVEGIWTNEQYYRTSSRFRCICRRIVSSGPIVDNDRCLDATVTQGHISGYTGLYNLLSCPPHMAANMIMRTNGDPATVRCCLLYDFP